MTDAMRDRLRREAERVLDWHGKPAGTWLKIEVVRDPLGTWWSGFSWSLGGDIDGVCGGACPIDAYQGNSRAAALAAAIGAIRLPSGGCKACQRAVRTMSRLLAELSENIA